MKDELVQQPLKPSLSKTQTPNPAQPEPGAWTSSGMACNTVLPMKKLNYKWLGPYLVDQVISRNAYWLNLPVSFGKVHPIFLVTLLHLFESDPIAKHQERHPPLPPLIICDGIEEYEVKTILDGHILCGKVEYLVHWKGYGVKEDEWHPIRDVQGSKQLITEFHCSHLQAPWP